MKKCLTLAASIVLGALFVMASSTYFLNLVPKPEFPEGTPIAHFMAAFGSTGYMNFVKVFELTGGILVAIPRTRNFGLLLLGPVIVNIIAFHTFITGPKSFLDYGHMWMLYVIIVCALFLLWDARKNFARLLDKN